MMTERDAYVYRSRIALGDNARVLEEINTKESSGAPLPTSLAAVRLLAMYLGPDENSDMVLLTLAEWLKDPAISSNSQMKLVAGIIYGREEKFSDALTVLQASEPRLEHHALCVQLYLQMDRLDVASKQLQKM